MRVVLSRSVLAFTVVALIVLSTVPFSASAASMAAVSASSAGKTVDRLALENNVTPPFMSGLENMAISATVEADTGEILTGNAALFYTTDSSQPAGEPPGANGGCTSEAPMSTPEPNCVTLSSSPAPGGRTYTGSIPTSVLGTLANGSLFRFVIVVSMVGGDPVTFPASDRAYNFLLDNSLPTVQSFGIPRAGDSSVPFPVSNSRTPDINFNVRDNTAGSALTDINNVQVLIDGVDETGNYTITPGSPGSEYDYRFVYTYGAGKAFGPGEHTILPVLSDQASNDVPEFMFAVDQTPPEVTGITAEPQIGVAQGNKTLTARGVAVNVTATVTDDHINTNGTSVSASFVNASLGLLSVPFALTATDPDNGTWAGVGTIPASFPSVDAELAIRIVAEDAGGNRATVDSTNQMILDPFIPVITDVDPGGFIPEDPFDVVATIVEEGSGLVENTVTLHFRLASGNFTGNVSGFDREGGFFVRTMSRIDAGNFSAAIPEARDGSVLSYFVSARDAAGNRGTSPTRSVVVDGSAPTVEEVPRRLFRGASPYVFEVDVSDTRSGVDPDAVTLFYSIDGGSSFQVVPMDAVSGTNATLERTFRATIELTLNEGDRIHYYYEAFDRANNIGSLGSEGNLLESLIDKTPPTFNLNAPASAQGPRFTITWSGQDPPLSTGGPGSGGLRFTVFARVAGDAEWVRIIKDTADTSLEVCAEAAFTYEFTGFATDFAGNSGPRGNDAMASTELSGSSCPERVTVTVLAPQPSAGGGQQRVNAQQGAGTLEIRWTAASSLTLAPSDSLRIDLLFSSDNGRTFQMVAPGLENTGSHNLSLAVPSCANCQVKVRATTNTGTSAEATSATFAVFNADPTVDLDQNGLYDAWEVEHFGRVGQADPNADTDRDGLNNRRESQHGTNPNLRDTDGDGFRDGLEVRVGTDPLDASSVPTSAQARTEQWTHFYWSVPAIWVLCALVFFIGLARRW